MVSLQELSDMRKKLEKASADPSVLNDILQRLLDTVSNPPAANAVCAPKQGC